MRIRSLYSTLLVTCIACAAPASLTASLIEVDLNAPGDKLLTLDTTTGLEWLDVTQTIGMSYNTAEIAFPMFRHATFAEVQGIVGEFGVTPNAGFTVGNFSPAQSMLDTMGYVISTGNTPFHQAFYDTGAATTDLDLIQLNLSAGTGIANLPQSALFSKSTSSGVVGNYMVRSAAVPEPSSFVLLGMAAIGLIVYRRRRSRLCLETQSRSVEQV